MLRIIAAAVLGCLLFAVPASAQVVHQGNGVWCDTADQTRQFLSLWNGANSAEAVAEVNTKAGKPDACRAMRVILQEVEAFEVVSTGTGTWRVVKVRVLGLASPAGWIRVPSFEQFTARKVELPGSDA